MFEHLPAGFFAFAALLGALFHVLIVKLRAFLAATLTGFGAVVADEVAEDALPRRDACGSGTEISAIQTRSQSGFVIFFSLSKQVPAMGCTGIAGALTVVAGLGTLLEGMSMMLGAGGLLRRHERQTQG
jgi:hypothetical protein